MKLSQRVARIKPSATLSINAKAKALAKQGIRIINFGVGEPDFDTPEYIREAAVDAIRRGHTRYTAVGGIDELKDAVPGNDPQRIRADLRAGRTSSSPAGESTPCTTSSRHSWTPGTR